MKYSLKIVSMAFSAVISCFQRVRNTFHIRHPPQLPPLCRFRKFRVQSRYTVIYAFGYEACLGQWAPLFSGFGDE